MHTGGFSKEVSNIPVDGWYVLDFIVVVMIELVVNNLTTPA